MRSMLLLFVAALAVAAQPVIQRPFLGEALDGHGALQVVRGAPGSFTFDHPAAWGVLSIACGPALCLAKTASAIVSGGASAAAPAGPALFAIDGTDAAIYFPGSRQFARWNAGSLTPFTLNVDGEILSIGIVSANLELAVRRGDEVWIVNEEGGIASSLPPGTGPVLLLGDSLVYVNSGALVLLRPDGSELTFAAPGVTALTQMGADYVEASAGAIRYALYIARGREQLFQLPQPVRETAPGIGRTGGAR